MYSKKIAILLNRWNLALKKNKNLSALTIHPTSQKKSPSLKRPQRSLLLLQEPKRCRR